jgi:hypothetical protein
MGQTQSSSLPSKEEILRKTRDGRDIVNMVFDYMVRKTTLRELYALANPEECKKYIFLTADALDVLFKRIDLEPKEKTKGTIYFQKVEELTKAPTSDDPRGKQRKVICLKLAFLYVRIFQIFASLALSVLDVEPETDVKFYEELQRLRGFDEDVPLFGRKPLRGGDVGQEGGSMVTADQRGGAADSSWPSDLEPLKPYIENIQGFSQYYKMGSLYIATGGYVNGKKQVIYEFMMPKKRSTQRVEGKLSVMTYNLNNYVLRLTEVKDPDGSLVPDFDPIRLTRSRISDPFQEAYKETDKATGKEKRLMRGIPDAIKARLKSVAKKSVEGEEDEVYKADVYDREKKYYGDDEFRRGTHEKKGEVELKEVREGLHTRVLFDAFRQTRPVKAHCIARALQLLGNDGLKSAFPKEIYTNICTAKFMVDNRSLPAADEKVTSEYGIYALAQLFYDVLGTNAPEISSATRAQYNDFLKKMRFVFEDTKSKEPASLGDVKNRLPSSVCEPSKVGKPLKVVNRELIRQMRIYAKRMIDYQVNHVANVVKVLKKLFLIPVKPGMSLQIHPNVAKYGIEEVNRIGEEARLLLIEYYSQCEGQYRQAVEVMGQSKGLVGV